MTNHPNRGRFSVRLAIATYFNMDSACVEDDHRYQPTRTPCAVYSMGNDYFTAAPIGKKPKGSDSVLFGSWVWQPVDDAFVASHGYQIWQHVEG